MDTLATARYRGDYLWGSFFQQGLDGRIASIDPATGMSVAEVPYRLNALDSAVEDARRAAPAWGATDLRERIAAAVRIRDQLQARRGAVAALICREMGKPVWEASLECAAAVRAIDLLVESARQVLAQVAHPSARGTMQRRPVGVVGTITPYPYPVYGPLQHMIPLLLAGNAVIWKPSSEVPLSSQRVAEIFDSSRLPPGVFSMVQGPRDPVGRALVTHEGVSMIVAAGSSEMADEVRAEASGTRAPWIQAGGKGWAIVCEDADLDRAAYETVTGAFLTAGQRCNATSRVLVEQSVASTFLERVASLTRALNISAPAEHDCFCGPLVSSRAKRNFDSQLDRYRRAGVEFLVEGGSSVLPPQLRRSGQAFVAPAIARVDGELLPRVPLPEEVQGPLLVAGLVDSTAQAVERFNSHPYGLAASVFTESQETFQGMANRLRAGAVNWNRGTIVASARYPNAGLDRSGQGAETNAGLLLATTWPQATLSAAGPFDPSYRVPGMSWPEEMGAIDPSSLRTPPYRNEDDETTIVPGIDSFRSK